MSLRWRDVDLETGTLFIRRSIDQDGTTLTEKDTKSHQQRRIALDKETVAVLTDHKEECEQRAKYFRRRLDSDAYVFSPAADGKAPSKPSTVTQRYRRLAERLAINTSLHKLRHYSTTELIATGVDPRTVSGRLGHSGGGSTTLRVYSAWVSESDQRAAKSLTGRMPSRPAVPKESAKTDPRWPYEIIASKIRNEILQGERIPGSPAPTQQDIARIHHVSLGTANRAVTLLKTWGLVDGTSGRRAVVLEPNDGSDTPPETASVPGSADVFAFKLIHLGSTVREFSAEIDASDRAQLAEVLRSAVRRHGGSDVRDYELEVRLPNSPELITRFAVV